MREQLARPAAAPAPRAAPRSAARVPARRVAARPATPPAMRALERTEAAVGEAEGARGAALRERRGPPDAAAPDAAPASPADPALLPPLAVAPAEEAATDEPGEPADLDVLLGAIAEAGQAGRDRAAAQALSGRADVARRGGRAEGGLRAGLTRALTTIRTGHATERRRVEAMIAAAHNQIDAAHHARTGELDVKGRDGITALRGVFTAHRDTLVGILAAAATRAQRIRTQGATRLDTRARAQETEAYAAGRDAWHHYGSGERGLRMADAASGVAIAVGQEIRAKRTEALAELEAGCVGLVDGVDQARRDSLTGLMDGLPGLETQIRSGVADARTELRTQRDAAHAALAEAAGGMLDELDAAERAAVARAEAALPPQIRQLYAAIHAARQGLAGAEDAARRGLTQREGEAEAILSDAEEPEADSAAAFTTEAVAMLAGMAEDAATEIAALPEAAGGAMDGLRRSGAAGLDQMARAAVAEAGARAAGIASRLDIFVSRVDSVLAGTPTRLEASLRQGRDDVRDQLRPGATALRTQLNEMLDPAAREVEASVTEALGHNATALGQMRGRMRDAANDAAWDVDHPYLATARDVGMVIAGVIVGILIVIAFVVAVIVACKLAIFLLVAAGVSAAVAEVIVILAAIAVAGYFAYQAYAEHRAAGQGGWEAAGNAALDMIGVNQMRAAFAPNLTPFERGLSFGQGAATFVTTFIPFARAARARIPTRFAGRVPALRTPRPVRVARVAVARSRFGRPVVRAWNNPARLGEAANAALPAPIRSALGVPARGVNVVGEGAIGAARSAWRALLPRRPGVEPVAAGTPPPTPEPPAPPPAAPPVAEAPRLPTPEAPRPTAPVAEAPRPAAPRPATPEAPARASPEAPTRATPETPTRTPAPTPPRAEAPPRPTEPATPTTPAEAPARAEPAPPELRLVRGGGRGDGRPRGRLGEAGRTPPRPAEPLPTEAAAEAVPEPMRLAAGAEGGVVEGGPRPWRPEVIQGGAGRGPVASIEGAGGGSGGGTGGGGPSPGPAPAPASTTPAPRRTGGRGRGGGRSAPRAADPATAAPDAAAPTRPTAGRATPAAAEAGAAEAGAAEAAVAEAAAPPSSAPPRPGRSRPSRAASGERPRTPRRERPELVDDSAAPVPPDRAPGPTPPGVDPLTHRIETMDRARLGAMVEDAFMQAQQEFLAARHGANPRLAATVDAAAAEVRGGASPTLDLAEPEMVRLFQQLAHGEALPQAEVGFQLRRPVAETIPDPDGRFLQRVVDREVGIRVLDNPERPFPARSIQVRHGQGTGETYGALEESLARPDPRGVPMGPRIFIEPPPRRGLPPAQSAAETGVIRTLEASRAPGGMVPHALEREMLHLLDAGTGRPPDLRFPRPAGPELPAPAGSSFADRLGGTGDLQGLAGKGSGATAQRDAGLIAPGVGRAPYAAANRTRRLHAATELLRTLNRARSFALDAAGEQGAHLRAVREAFRRYVAASEGMPGAGSPGEARAALVRAFHDMLAARHGGAP